MGRASMPSSVCSCRNVNCVGRNVKPAGFSGSIARVLGVSAREDTIRVRKPRGGPANASTSKLPWGRNTTAVFRDSDHEKATQQRGDVGETGEQPPIATVLDLSPQV